MRAFLAIELPAAVRADLGRRMATARELGGKARWVPRENLHVTLSFLGEIDDRRASALCARLESELAAVESFEIDLGGGGFFGSEQRPRVLWVGLGSQRGAAAIEELARSVHEVVSASDLETEDRAFHPHLTLARPKARWRPDQLTRVLDELPPPGAHVFRVDRVVLIRSVLRPTGAVYTAEAIIRLANPS